MFIYEFVDRNCRLRQKHAIRPFCLNGSVICYGDKSQFAFSFRGLQRYKKENSIIYMLCTSRFRYSGFPVRFPVNVRLHNLSEDILFALKMTYSFV